MARSKFVVVKKERVTGKSRTKSGNKVKVGTRVYNDKGESRLLLTPAGKAAKAARELKEGVKLTNEGTVKIGKNGKPMRLTKAQRAWRSGYLDRSKDSAKAYNSKRSRSKVNF